MSSSSRANTRGRSSTNGGRSRPSRRPVGSFVWESPGLATMSSSFAQGPRRLYRERVTQARQRHEDPTEVM